MKYSLINQWNALDEKDEIFKELDNLVGWKKTPPFYRPGRTGWLKLDKPINISKEGIFTTIKSLKLKGIGYCNDNLEITQPTQKYFNRIFPHLGFTKEGKFCMVESDQAPLGGLEFGRAEMEYYIAKKLSESGCPSVIPIRLYKYDRKFTGSNGESNLAVVITGLPVDTPFRADCAYRYNNNLSFDNPMNNHWPFSNPQSDEERKHVESLSKLLKFQGNENVSLDLISYFYEKYGQTLRKFHAAGFYRYSGSLDNYDYCPETDQVYLIDLDSSRILDECSDIEKPLQVIRDLASAFFNLSASLMHPWHIKKFPLSDVIKSAPFRSILKGYYHDVSEELINGVAEVFSEYYNPLHEKVFLHAQDIIEEEDREKQIAKWKPLWMDRKEVYSLLMVSIWFLHEKSSMNKLYPNQLNWMELIEDISVFASPEIASKIKNNLDKLVVCS
ncbi:hypothetical protein [Bacillus thuringiensis]|uniref:hypothetical protein n=1 Tax=Bacillus thuringiensis TaxID=1428 RepID=UPI000BF582A6|nr:hypothetical protein [Bacillus thuringiensis]PFP05738.1 hypothetical protein COJ91_16910 [Bacillus thuringiensis]PGP55181.1 hypothetical protein CN992_07685 [Bacillus thuringiensis]PGY51947.1 hypothetical protein COE24_29455 [Bacillus thuringiensis]